GRGLKLSDGAGLGGSRRREVRLSPDPAPKVRLVRPAAGRDPTLLRPDALVPVDVVAEDGVYALRRVFLEYRVGRDGPLCAIPLIDAHLLGGLLPAVAGGMAAPLAARPQPLRAEATPTVLLSAFLRPDGTPVRDGDVIILRA